MFIGCSNNISRITSVFYVDTWFPVKVLLDQSNIKPWQIASQHLNLRSLEAESDFPQLKFPDFGTNFPVKIWIDTLFYYVIYIYTVTVFYWSKPCFCSETIHSAWVDLNRGTNGAAHAFDAMENVTTRFIDLWSEKIYHWCSKMSHIHPLQLFFFGLSDLDFWKHGVNSPSTNCCLAA